jgi:hypothetical protein
MGKKLIKAVTSFIVLSLLVIGVSVFLIYEENLIGPAYLLLGFLGLGILKIFKIEFSEVMPDIVFGVIDNGVLIFAAVLGGIFAGVTGAVLGGAAGNTITDGVGGLFEGRIAEKLRRNNKKIKRTSLSTMLGKMVGCLWGAGIGLILIWGIKITGEMISVINVF